jgi:molecular chaperone GrpE (heat shock protein)
MIREWLASLLGKARIDEQFLAVQEEAQTLRLALKDREERLLRLKKDLTRHRASAAARENERVRLHLERLLTDTAAPVAQLLTQTHLVEAEGKAVTVRDVLAAATRLVHALEDNGLELEGSVGETVAFDPDRHYLLGKGPEASALTGRPVVIRFVGVAHEGKVLRKAGVEERKA